MIKYLGRETAELNSKGVFIDSRFHKQQQEIQSSHRLQTKGTKDFRRVYFQDKFSFPAYKKLV